MADITGKDTAVKGVNSVNYVRYFAHTINGTENSEILATGTHDLFKIPAGFMLTGLKAVALADTTSSGSATIQFKLKIGESAEAINSAVGKADIQTGDVINAAVTAIKGYSADSDLIVELTVGTAALTAIDLLVIAETVPVKEFLTAG